MTARDFKPLFTWRSAICDSDLAPTTRHVALTMALHMNERGGSCYPSAETLARETGLSVSTVREHRGRLESAGWLRLVERGGLQGERRRASAYEATFPDGDDPSGSGRGAGSDPSGSPRGTPPGNRADPSGSRTPGLHGGHHVGHQEPPPAPPSAEVVTLDRGKPKGGWAKIKDGHVLFAEAEATAAKVWEATNPKPGLEYTRFRGLVAQFLDAGWSADHVARALLAAKTYTVASVEFTLRGGARGAATVDGPSPYDRVLDQYAAEEGLT